VKAVDERGEFLLGGSDVGQVIRPHLDSGSGAHRHHGSPA
jgi:hypothetical protein